jgi:hypothetical protein
MRLARGFVVAAWSLDCPKSELKKNKEKGSEML